jgi:hypothetical protein
MTLQRLIIEQDDKWLMSTKVNLRWQSQRPYFECRDRIVDIQIIVIIDAVTFRTFPRSIPLAGFSVRRRRKEKKRDEGKRQGDVTAAAAAAAAAAATERLVKRTGSG